MQTLESQIKAIAQSFAKMYPATSQRFLDRLNEGSLTRDENNQSHYCAYFLPYNPLTKKFFLVHHKKSGLWIAPGGHIDKGELLLETLNREIKEELGMEDVFSDLPTPFLASITIINNPLQTCTEHLDTWFLLETDGSGFNVGPEEFHETKWFSIKEARKIITDPPNLLALEIIDRGR